jgi:hypothetical protein
MQSLCRSVNNSNSFLAFQPLRTTSFRSLDGNQGQMQRKALEVELSRGSSGLRQSPRSDNAVSRVRRPHAGPNSPQHPRGLTKIVGASSHFTFTFTLRASLLTPHSSRLLPARSVKTSSERARCSAPHVCLTMAGCLSVCKKGSFP